MPKNEATAENKTRPSQSGATKSYSDGAQKHHESLDGPTRSTRPDYKKLGVEASAQQHDAPTPSTSNKKDLDLLKAETGIIPEGAGKFALTKEQIEAAKVKMQTTSPQAATPGFS